MTVPNPRTYELPKLPPNMEWVIVAQSDRFTINLSYTVPTEIDTDVDDDDEDGDEGEDAIKHDPDAKSGYVKSHTVRHDVMLTPEEFERLVSEEANRLLLHYNEGNRHALWADRMMRRNR